MRVFLELCRETGPAQKMVLDSASLIEDFALTSLAFLGCFPGDLDIGHLAVGEFIGLAPCDASALFLGTITATT